MIKWMGRLALLVVLGGCAATWVERQSTAEPPPAAPAAVFVQNIRVGDEIWQGQAIRMRRTLIGELRRLNGFPQVLEALPDPPPADVLIVSGNLTEIDKGNVAARWIIGIGAGRARTSADIELLGSSGRRLAQFTVAKTYGGGAGLGGANLLDMDDLVDQLGVAAAGSVTSWVKTGKFE